MIGHAGASSRSAIEPELLAGERLLWSGRPDGGVRFFKGDVVAIPLTLMWAGFAFFWEWTVLHSDAPVFMKLWGIPFVLVGLYISVGRFFIDAYRRRRTFYAVTDRRVLAVTRWTRGHVRAIGLASVGEMTVTSDREGAGTLTFGPEPARGPFHSPGWPGAQSAPLAFEGIEGVRAVHDTILRAQETR
jgi:hypothetical protein